MSKRQLSLAEAFLHAQNAPLKPAVPPAKRPRRSSASPPLAAHLSTAPSTSTATIEPRKGAAAQLSTSATTTTTTTTFSPAAYRASLSTTSGSPSEADLLALECATLDPSWLDPLQSELRKPYFLELKRFLWGEGLRATDDREKGKLKVFPPAHDVYAWSRYTPLQNVRVVILGQDPYHDDGLCFSVRPGVKIPPSLRNIYKEIKEEYPEFDVPKHGNLISLARAGVLLLNTSLTVAPHKAGSHSNKGWETFTDKVVELVDRHGGKDGKGVVVLAWGAWAAKRVAKMDKKKHLILTSAHPSPLSARRGFFGNGHFRKANDWLEARYGVDAKIDWTTLEPEEDEAGLEKQ
ncbi:hypothetical protein Rhopal_007609-T1 [Rhodotorula paludigena]|uniref:Uracil-DNA glycosylase n=1 Tax=Rhodotorula paludigena TaxID=86838 RepID=A0AAV5GYE2_9BASI|nr:hypothetical protein Rhopal_007609-T1 [Rhodotorula paludigena]